MAQKQKTRREISIRDVYPELDEEQQKEAEENLGREVLYKSSPSGTMLSIEECKKFIGETKRSDKEIEELRDALYVSVEKILDPYFEELPK